ncbi:MFS transporter [Nocardioides sp. LHD-245]|uniref:MFS transporter n=1 Tax=Nocardioides sp. LHD-245 TaxID=3051387 RepID=UPI0027DFDF6E|nr:MFS transporter [Nocardioides sp. LHD-245]
MPPPKLLPTLLLLTTVGGIVSSLGASLVPRIARELDVPLTSAQWTLTATMIAAAVSTPLIGRYAVAHRRRTMIVTGLGVVIAGTVLSALAIEISALGLPVLIAGRAAQGIGMAMAPLAMAVARDVFPPERVSSVMAVLSVGMVAGAGVGYPLAALVAQVGGLAAAFWFGTIISLLTLMLSARYVPPAPFAAPAPVNVTDALLLGAGTVALLLGVSRTTSWGWDDPRTITLLATGSAAVALWVRVSLARANPLVDLRLAFTTAAAGPNIAGLLAGAGMYMGLTLLMVLVQTRTAEGWGLGSSVLVAGLLLVPYSVMSVLGSRVSLLVGRYVDPARVLPFGCAIYLISTVFLAFRHDRIWHAVVAMVVAGLGSGGTFATLPVLLVRVVPVAETSSALAFNQVLRYFGFAVGSALVVTVLTLASGGPTPTERGFVVASLLNAAVWVVAIAAICGFGRRARLPPGGPDSRPG